MNVVGYVRAFFFYNAYALGLHFCLKLKWSVRAHHRSSKQGPQKPCNATDTYSSLDVQQITVHYTCSSGEWAGKYVLWRVGYPKKLTGECGWNYIINSH